MRARKLGDDVRVTVSEIEVRNFKDRWPCSGLPDKGVGFTFDSGGDLVNITTVGVDGDAALALSQDAWQFAVKKWPDLDTA